MEIINKAMTFKELADKSKVWRGIAYGYCKDKSLADDLVQDMFLKLHDLNIDEHKITGGYVRTVLFNLFKDHVTKANKNRFIPFEDYHAKKQEEPFEYDDEEFSLVSELSENEKNILLDNYHESYGQIAEREGVSRKTICLQMSRIRNRVLGNDVDLFSSRNLGSESNMGLYKNKRLKYKK